MDKSRSICFSSPNCKSARSIPQRFHRHCPIWLSAVLLLMAVRAELHAQLSFTSDNGAITITGYSGTDTIVTIPSTLDGYPVKAIGPSAFYMHFNLARVIMPDSVTSIGVQAFAFCGGLNGVTIPEGVTNIGDDAFWFCNSLTNITIPKNVTRIGAQALAACYNLKTIMVDTNNPVFSSMAGVLFDIHETSLLQCPAGLLGNYTIPGTVISIGPWAFSYCRFGSIKITNNITTIGTGAFFNCGSLTNVMIGNSVTNIGDEAFIFCQGLKEIIIPDGVTSIGSQAFSSCTGVTNITIPKSTITIGSGAFSGCTRMAAILVDAQNPVFISLAGVLFDLNQTTLIQFPAGKAGNYTIPNTVRNIDDLSFSGCITLTNIAIPNSVTNVGYEAFDTCTNLASITIPRSVVSIGDFAFDYCFSLKSVYFQGDSPRASLNLFGGNMNATVYYLPGTLNWNSFYGGVPAVLWNPQAQTEDGSFGVRTNQFGFNITGTTNISVVVEACTDPAIGAWIPLQTNILTSGSTYFHDPQWTSYQGRFYRIRSP